MQILPLGEKKSDDLTILGTHARPWPLQTALCSPLQPQQPLPSPHISPLLLTPHPRGLWERQVPPRTAWRGRRSGFCRSPSPGMYLSFSPRLHDILARNHYHPIFSWSASFSATVPHAPTAVRKGKRLAFPPPRPWPLALRT